jgi:DNA-binding NarL/FixJ family response regulator
MTDHHPSLSSATPAPAYAPKIWGQMPTRMKVLYVTTLHRTGGWLAEAFGADSATQVLLEEAIGVTAGLARLRDEVFDAVLVSHETDVLDGIEFVEGLRGGGHDEPMILLGTEASSDLAAQAYEVGADAYCCVAETTTRSLLWTFARAIERAQLMRENRRLVQVERQRLAQEHQEAERLLTEQRALIVELERIRDGAHALAATAPPIRTVTQGNPADRDTAEYCDDSPASLVSSLTAASPTRCDLPERLVNHYRELLRAYVVMGVGNLASEMNALASLLTDVGISAQQAMQLHVHVLEDLIGSLGSRSARHVMNRADLLVVEVMAHLADGYRRRYDERRNPPQQMTLPGFGPPVASFVQATFAEGNLAEATLANATMAEVVSFRAA